MNPTHRADNRSWQAERTTTRARNDLANPPDTARFQHSSSTWTWAPLPWACPVGSATTTPST